MTTATAVKLKETKAVEPEQAIEVNPKRVSLNSAGFVYRNLVVRMPEGSTQDDLRNPRIWKRCQTVAVSALMRLDNLLILAHDESWFARCIVTAASGVDANIIVTKVGSFRAPDEGLFSDGTFQVFWCGHGYSVKRVSDGSSIGSKSFATEGQARAAIATMTPTAVAR